MLPFLFAVLAQASAYETLAPACGRAVTTELYAQENFESFPCSLKSARGRKNTPRIWVIGETHDYALLNPDVKPEDRKRVEDMIAFWNMIDEAARQGEIYKLSEGYVAAPDGWPATVASYVERMRDHQAVLPIEDGFAYTLATFTAIRISYQMAMFRTLGSNRAAAEKDFRHFARWLFAMVWSSPYLNESWKRVPRPLKNPNAEAAGVLLDNIACDVHGYEKIDEWAASAPIDQVYDLAELFEAVGGKFAQRLAGLRVHQVDLPLEPFGKILTGINRGGVETYGKWQETGLDLTSNAREAVMAANTAKIYCAMIEAGTTRPLVLQVGRVHVPNLIKRLQAMAVRSGLPARRIQTHAPSLDAK